MAELTVIIAFLHGSVFYCWAAAAMATAGHIKITFDVARPRIQANVGMIIFSAVLAVSILYKFLIRDMVSLPAETADLAFSCAVIAAAVVAAAAFGDRPGSIGLPIRNWHVTLLFLVPPAATILLPGGIVNWQLLLKALTPAIFVLGLAEELLLRGYLQTRFQAAWGFFPGLLAAALAAVIFRLPMLAGADPVTILTASVLHFAIWGIVAGLIYARTGNIYGLVILHVFHDVATLALAGFTIN